MFLKELCELNGVSGNEKPVRDYIIEQLKQHVDEYRIDKIGNLVVQKKCAAPHSSGGNAEHERAPLVLLCAHMDEVGLFVTEITGEGYLKFTTVGGIDPKILISKTVLCGNDNLPGVIGCKAVHLQKLEERKQTLSINDLYIDIGAGSKEEAEKNVKIGDYVAFAAEFARLESGFYKAKALDDRVGCALLMETMAHRYPCNVVGAFTVQEEVGLRGSKVVSNYIQADLAIVLEATGARDITEKREEEWIVELGKGPACSLMDALTIYKPELIAKVSELAREHNIPLQFRRGTAAANDAGNLHLAGPGIPLITLSIPCRNINSMNSLIAVQDYENCRTLVRLILEACQQFIE